MEPGWVLGLLLCVQLCGFSAGPAAISQPSPAMSNSSVHLRLVGGGHRCAGRVEVMHEGEWGSVCTYDFDWDARGAGVVCRQLGCGAAVRASPYAPFGQGEGRIWLHPFNCRGTERALQDCYNFGWGRHFCGHEWDVGVTCSGEAPPRMWGGGRRRPWLRCDGRLEVASSPDVWTGVSAGPSDNGTAAVACRQLGCGALERAYAAPGGGSGLAELRCDGSEELLERCSTSGPSRGPSARRLRLAGGPGRCAGRVQVYMDGAWSSVCRDAWSLRDAAVVCRQLRCGAALQAPGPERFGSGTGTTWAGNGGCAGTEAALWDCPARGGCGGGGAGAVCAGDIVAPAPSSVSLRSRHFRLWLCPSHVTRAWQQAPVRLQLPSLQNKGETAALGTQRWHWSLQGVQVLHALTVVFAVGIHSAGAPHTAASHHHPAARS
uniref:SRCR domain-containing protein n=1 Tax=Coturnix japonica TaxID=93934 RepID=A0A8C2TR60_COTJA